LHIIRSGLNTGISIETTTHTGLPLLDLEIVFVATSAIAVSACQKAIEAMEPGKSGPVELLTWLATVGILIIVVGVYLVNAARMKTQRSAPGEYGFKSLWLGLSAALCWSISPIFIRYGLAELPSPILGVTVGITASAVAYAVILLFRRANGHLPHFSFFGESTWLKILAAVLVGLSTWVRWVALDLTGVATVLALTLVSVPIVNFLAPFVSGRDLERVTLQVWAGSGLIITGSLVLISVVVLYAFLHYF